MDPSAVEYWVDTDSLPLQSVPTAKSHKTADIEYMSPDVNKLVTAFEVAYVTPFTTHQFAMESWLHRMKLLPISLADVKDCIPKFKSSDQIIDFFVNGNDTTEPPLTWKDIDKWPRGVHQHYTNLCAQFVYAKASADITFQTLLKERVRQGRDIANTKDISAFALSLHKGRIIERSDTFTMPPKKRGGIAKSRIVHLIQSGQSRAAANFRCKFLCKMKA
jgi:hypothetical protein